MEDRLAKINVELERHNQAAQGWRERNDARQREQVRLDEAQKKHDVQETIVRGLHAEKRKLKESFNFAEDMALRYAEAVKSEPKLISWSRQKGLTANGMLEHFTSQLAEACRWVGKDEWEWAASELETIKVGGSDRQIPRPVFERSHEIYAKTSDPEKFFQDKKSEMEQLDKDIAFAEHKLEVARREVDRISASLQTELAIYGEPLPQETLVSLMEEKGVLESELDKCRKWETWGDECGRHAVARTMAVEESCLIEEKLQALNKERADIVRGVVEPIERGANDILKRAGLTEGIRVGVEATAKRAELSITTGDGVSIAALAKSRKLAYGIAVLSTIQQLSTAVRPVLVAECAELGKERFEALAKALQPEKGNIILENHIIPDMEHVRT